jgi:hypothetical protein
MTQPQWEDINVPRGTFFSWGIYQGQNITGKVMDYEPDGGIDFNNNRCPQLTVELTLPAKSIDKQNGITDLSAGEVVSLTCGQVSLKRAVKTADPVPGDLISITLSDLVKVANGTVKEFAIKIARTGKRQGTAPAGNPFTTATAPAPHTPAQQTVQTSGNPFGQPAAQAPVANPFGPAPAETSQPAGNPFGQPQQAPAGNPFAQPASQTPPAGNPFAQSPEPPF